jgi:hypothetical protein
MFSGENPNIKGLLTGLITFLILLLIFFGDSEESPLEVKISLGRTKAVANGQALIWFAQPEVAWREDQGRLVDVAYISIKCSGEEYFHTVFKDILTEEACGIRVKLLDLLGSNLPVAKFLVVWDEE